MNPYTLLVNQQNFAPHNGARSVEQENILDNSLSHAAYRLVGTVDRLLFKRGR